MTNSGVEPFGRRVAKRRAERGWTQLGLAERIAVSRVALSHIEAGLSSPNERTVTLLAGWFDCEPHELAAGTDYPQAKLERLPLVASRHTEVAHQLAVLAAELRWIAAAATADALVYERREALQRWRVVLNELLAQALDPAERRALKAALRTLND